MSKSANDISRVPEEDSPQEPLPADPEAYQAARAQFAARRAWKRARRRARNPLYFPWRSLALLFVLVLLTCAATLALVFAFRGEPAAIGGRPVIELVEAPSEARAPEPTESAVATSMPAVEVILAPATPENMVLEGPPIPTVLITNTPVPLRVGVKAAVFDVGNDKLNIRNKPSLTDSQVLFREDAGKIFDIIGGPREADGFTWWQVRDPQFQVEGWAVANYLRTVAEEAGR